MRYANLLAVLAALLFAAPGYATLVVATDFPSGSPLGMVAGTTSSAMTASVFDPPPASGPNDNLFAYQVRLSIVPQGGATGTLTFATPMTGTGPEPANYVLPDSFGMSVTNTGSGLFFFDVYLLPMSTSGVDVPDSPGNNLVAMTFTASPDALGLFDIVALPGATNTVWTDNTFMTREFDNVTVAGGPTVIGQVSVAAIPEAGACAALALVAAAVGAWRSVVITLRVM